MTIWLASKERTQASRTPKASPLTKAPLAPCLATATPRAGSAAGDRSRRPRVPPYLGPTASTGSCSATAGSWSSAGATPRPPRERVGGAAVRPAQSPGTRRHRQGKANQGRPLRSGRLRSPTCARAGAPPQPPPRSARRNSGPRSPRCQRGNERAGGELARKHRFTPRSGASRRGLSARRCGGSRGFEASRVHTGSSHSSN